MKKIAIIYNLILAVIFLSCEDKEYELFVSPESKIEISKTAVNVNEPVYVKNLGTGEYFSFWPGESGNNYAMKENGHRGEEANRGRDFEYRYTLAGKYNMVVVASSYDEKEEKFVESTTQIEITVNVDANGDGNNFDMFALKSVMPDGYHPRGIINNDRILIPIANVGLVKEVFGQDYDRFIRFLNQRPPLFTLSKNGAQVYSPEGIELFGDGEDDYETNFFDTITYLPNAKTYTVDFLGSKKEYSVMPMFYPQLLTFEVDAVPAAKWVENYIDYMQNPDNYNLENTRHLELSYSDYAYYGILIVEGTPGEAADKVPVFTLSDNTKCYLKGTEQEVVSGVTHLDFTQPVSLTLVKSYSGFQLESTVDLKVIVY